ncbi:hypothetical protein OCF08_21750 [Bacillus cereus]|nr:hypothetical protein [Bacillus cereus]
MSNPYSLLLKEAISKSRLSLSEIENEMRKRGFNKNKAYLSSLQNGKVDPPPFKVTHALCEIIGSDPVRLALTGTLMEISKLEFVPIVTDTMTTMLATLIDINKNELSGFLSDSFTNHGIETNEEEVLELLTFSKVKYMLDETVESLPFKELFEKGIAANSWDEISRDITDSPSEIDNTQELTPDETEYLKECLNVYRKLNLKPTK